MAKDIVYGDGSSSHMDVTPRYSAMRIPEGISSLYYSSTGRLCADFGQVYFPSQNTAMLINAYKPETTMDPWHRPSRYHPFIHFLCSYTYCKLPYGPACLFHLAVQITFFIASLAYAFRVLNISQFFTPSLLLVNICLFMSPVGLSWVERGQFSLYVGLSYLWLMLALITQKRKFVIFSAFFAFFKWVAFPYIFVAFMVYLLSSARNIELKIRMTQLIIFLTVIFIPILLFLNDSVTFVNGLRWQELSHPFGGISLGRFLPVYLVKILPLLLILVGYLISRRIGKNTHYLIPFFTGTAIVMLTYPTLAYDYSAPYLTAFIPFMIYWARLPDIDKWMGHMVLSAFLVFLLLVSFSNKVFVNSEDFVLLEYLAFSLFIILTPLLIRYRNDDSRGQLKI